MPIFLLLLIGSVPYQLVAAARLQLDGVDRVSLLCCMVILWKNFFTKLKERFCNTTAQSVYTIQKVQIQVQKLQEKVWAAWAWPSGRAWAFHPLVLLFFTSKLFEDLFL